MNDYNKSREIIFKAMCAIGGFVRDIQFNDQENNTDHYNELLEENDQFKDFFDICENEYDLHPEIEYMELKMEYMEQENK